MNYLEALSTTVKELSLEDWGNEKWLTLANLITPEVIESTIPLLGSFPQLFAGLEILARPPKNLERIKKKITEQPPTSKNYFKAVSELLAGRILCEVHEIASKCEAIEEVVKKEGGIFYYRTFNPGESKSYIKEGKYVDIIQFVYVYLPKVDHIIEFQVGHPFAALTFTIDSALRDGKEGYVDLWTDGFYGEVKTEILKKANGGEAQTNELFVKAKNIHKGEIPEALEAILDKI